MPRPPDVGWLGELNFVTNFFLAGCDVEPWLFVQFAKDPSYELLKLFFLPDLTDIGQVIFDPKGKRRRRPGRHGRKRRRPPGIPDPSDLIGQKARGVLNPYNALNYAPFNAMFRILNAYERVAITVAVVEGLTDVGFEGLLGMIEVKPELCTTMPRLRRTKVDAQQVGGEGPEIWPIGLEVMNMEEGFISDPFGCNGPPKGYKCYLRMVVFNSDYTQMAKAQMAIGDPGGGTKVMTDYRDIGPRETTTFLLNYHAEFGEALSWGIRNRNNFPLVLEAEVLCFAESWIPWL